jgi:hypothetical protein
MQELLSGGEALNPSDLLSYALRIQTEIHELEGRSNSGEIIDQSVFDAIVHEAKKYRGMLVERENEYIDYQERQIAVSLINSLSRCITNFENTQE